MVYLRRGHEQALQLLADPPHLPPPPFITRRGLPMAVGCEVLKVEYAPPDRKISPHVRLLVTLRVRENPVGVVPEERTRTRGLVANEDWVVMVHAPTAGAADFLILRDRYEHALRQYRLCKEVGRCSVRMLWLQVGVSNVVSGTR